MTVALERIADSCGYGVPRMELVGQRDRLLSWAESKGDAGLADYRADRNDESIDGLPGTDRCARSRARSRSRAAASVRASACASAGASAVQAHVQARCKHARLDDTMRAVARG